MIPNSLNMNERKMCNAMIVQEGPFLISAFRYNEECTMQIKPFNFILKQKKATFVCVSCNVCNTRTSLLHGKKDGTLKNESFSVHASHIKYELLTIENR